MYSSSDRGTGSKSSKSSGRQPGGIRGGTGVSLMVRLSSSSAATNSANFLNQRRQPCHEDVLFNSLSMSSTQRLASMLCERLLPNIDLRSELVTVGISRRQ